MLCDQICACAITSSSLTITGSGTPNDPWVLEQAGSSAITQLQIDVANLFALMAGLPASYVLKAGDSMTGTLTITPTAEALRIQRTVDGAFIAWYDTGGLRQAYIQALNTDNSFRVVSESGKNILLMAGATERMRLLADGTGILMFKTSAGLANTGFEMLNTNTLQLTRGDTAQCLILNKVSTGATGSGTIFQSFQLAGTQIGTITRNALTSAVLYNTSSDEELKNVIGDLDPELAEYVLALVTPVMFSWKDDDGNTPIAGYIAQQVAKAWPQSIELGLVTPGYGDINDRTWDEDGNETTPDGVWGPWQMSHTILIPLLHASLVRTTTKLANLRAEFDDLKAQVATLAKAA